MSDICSCVCMYSLTTVCHVGSYLCTVCHVGSHLCTVCHVGSHLCTVCHVGSYLCTVCYVRLYVLFLLCLHRFYNLCWVMGRSGAKWTLRDDVALVEKVSLLNVDCEPLIDWQALADGWPQ